MLASDLADSLQENGSGPNAFSDAVDEANLDVDFVRGGEVSSAPAAIITASPRNATDTARSERLAKACGPRYNTPSATSGDFR